MTEQAKDKKWDLWRGSPELLAQVVRTALRVTDRGDGSEPSCTIDVEVDGDHEIFSTPAEFTTSVTREALRHFQRIQIEVGGESLRVKIGMVWKRPWSKFGWGPDAEVKLEVSGADEASVERAVGAVETSIQRGRTDGGRRQTAVGIGIGYALMGAAGVAAVSGLYLLKVSFETIWIVAMAVVLLGAVIGLYWGAWIYPSLEVAPSGQTNLSRTIRFGGPLAIGFILSGLAKLLYG